MNSKMTHFGVGPKIFAPAFIYALLAGIASHFLPQFFSMHSISYSILLTAGVIFLILGIPMWLAGVYMIVRAFGRGELVTTGVFGLVRHPIYSAWIVFNFSAIALLCSSWPMLFTSLIAYINFKRLINREDEYLEKKFGKDYLDYRSRVNEIIPIPRF